MSKLRRNFRTRLWYLILLCTVTVYYFSLQKLGKIKTEDVKHTQHSSESFSKALEVTFAIVICSKTRKEKTIHTKERRKIASDITRQLDQAEVLIKSALALSSSIIRSILNLRFHLIVDQDLIFDKMVKRMEIWPKIFTRRLKLEKHFVSYPKGSEGFRTHFRICATARLFVPSMLSDVDSLIFIDTDFIFMRPPEELWSHFNRFDEKQMAGMVPCLYHYGTSTNLVPYFGKTGLNAGMMLLNLTRMKDFPGGWTEICLEKEKEFRSSIKLADQDILNIIFNENPNYLYELDCTWNYRMFLCQKGNLCSEASERGISLLHGNALAFVANEDAKIKNFYDAWKVYNLEESLAQLLKDIRNKLSKIQKGDPGSKCSLLPNIDHILTYGLERHINRDLIYNIYDF